MKLTSPRVLATAASTLLTLAFTASTHAATITFESVPLGSPNGPAGVWNGQAGTGALGVDDAVFSNSYTDFGGGFSSWDGFAYSNLTDTATVGFGNQYSAYPGGGAGGSSQYAIGFDAATISFGLTDLSGKGASISNTTYAALSMLNGDMFAKKFGGVSGNDPDFFKLTLSGFAGGAATGTFVDFYLADFRFVDNSQDYIVNSWTNVDFSPLGTVDQVRFSFSSSDVGGFGINTPTYFALDNLTAVPEPSALALLACGGIALAVRRQCR